MEYLILFFAIVAMVIICKILAFPLKKIIKLLINIFIGLVLILLVNNFGSNIGLHISFNIVTAIVAGTLGVPGVLCLIVLNYIF